MLESYVKKAFTPLYQIGLQMMIFDEKNIESQRENVALTQRNLRRKLFLKMNIFKFTKVVSAKTHFNTLKMIKHSGDFHEFKRAPK